MIPLWVQVRRHVDPASQLFDGAGQDLSNIALYGQENNCRTWTICKLNMFLHGVMSANIEHGDTLGDPQHMENGELMVFDRVIANLLSI